MYLFALLIRSGIFAEGRFLGKVIDEWVDDLKEFIHSKLPRIVILIIIAIILTQVITLVSRRIALLTERKDGRSTRNSQVKTFANVLRTTLNCILWTLTALQILAAMGANLGPS